MQSSDKFIDLEKIIASKNPRLLRWMPGFVLRYVKRILHVDEVNAAMYRMRDVKGVPYAAAILNELGAKVNIVGLENIPANGGYIFAANHPLGGLDGIAFMHAVGQVRSDIRFLVNDILMNLKNFDPIFVPVNKLGSNSKVSLERIDQIYASDAAVLIFPAGLVSRKQKGGIKDLEWKKSFISKAVKYQKEVIPVFVEGTNSAFFYNLAYWRKRLGIKANIEMFYLVDEMFKQRNKTITLIFGKPISYTTFDKTASETHWAKYVKGKVYELSKKLN